MSSHLRTALCVARWEFTRYFKLRDVITTLVLFLVLGSVAVAVKKMWTATEKPARLAVIGHDKLPFSVPDDGPITLDTAQSTEEATLRQAVTEKDLDGLLLIEDEDHATLFVRDPPPWQPALSDALTAARREVRLATTGLTSTQLADVFAPYEIEVETASKKPQHTVRNLVSAGVVCGLMLLGIFTGTAQLFISITGEKTQRVSEQIISAIPIQPWVDGKILGQSALALTSMTTITLGYALTNRLLKLVGESMDLPLELADPTLLALFVLLAVLGFAFWFSFFAAVAATIDDPNSSTRGAFLMLPPLAFAVGFAALKTPDNVVVRAMSWLPVTSPTTMSARLAMGGVPWWEVTLAVTLLVCGIWVARKVAGKVFELSVLMVGKEPGVGEVWRWLRGGG